MTLSSIKNYKNIIVCGHFGSGKTNVSVSFAKLLAQEEKKVTLLDFDIVNPYFRAADAVSELNALSIDTIVPMFANTNVDIPTLDADVNRVFMTNNINSLAIFDVGGDNGATALGRFNREFTTLGYSMIYVTNMYRPLTENIDLCLENIAEIEYYSRLKFTHIVNNSNLGIETKAETVTASFAYAAQLSEKSALPLLCTTVVKSDFSQELIGKYPENKIVEIQNSTKNLFI